MILQDINVENVQLKVSFSNLGKHSEITRAHIRELGGVVVRDIQEADILMTIDKINLTVKTLAAVILGKPIVTFKWLSFSLANGEFEGECYFMMKYIFQR